MCGPFSCLMLHNAGESSATMSGVLTMPLSRSADIVARVLSWKLSLVSLLGYDLPLGFASNASVHYDFTENRQ